MWRASGLHSRANAILCDINDLAMIIRDLGVSIRLYADLLQ